VKRKNLEIGGIYDSSELSYFYNGVEEIENKRKLISSTFFMFLNEVKKLKNE